jgi:aminopeptidase N
MLRQQIGEDAFYAGLKRYLEANRGKNAVTADFVKAVEDATHLNIDEFLGQWIYGAGAPRFELGYTYDSEKQQVALSVKQTQKVDGRVGIFRVPVEVEITTTSGPKLYPITVSKANQVFAFPSDAAPLMVLFDRGGQVLKSTNFHKEKKEWLYQAKNATEVGDRADAVLALGKTKADEEIVEALGDVLCKDKFWGVRATAAGTLGQLGGAAASKTLLAAADSNDQPWLRSPIVTALGNFRGNAAVIEKLEAIAKQDRSYRVRAAALQALGQLKTPNALATLEAAVAAESPDGFLRKAALRAFGSLGDDKAVPLLLEWTSVGKPIDSRTAAIYSLARLQKDDQNITQKIASYLTEAHFPVRMASIYALGWRGDGSAIPALESLLKSDGLSIEMVPMIKNQIARLKKPAAARPKAHVGENEETGEEDGPASENNGGASEVIQRLDKLELLVREMSERLKSVENRLPPPKN